MHEGGGSESCKHQDKHCGRDKGQEARLSEVDAGVVCSRTCKEASVARKSKDEQTGDEVCRHHMLGHIYLSPAGSGLQVLFLGEKPQEVGRVYSEDRWDLTGFYFALSPLVIVLFGLHAGASVEAGCCLSLEDRWQTRAVAMQKVRGVHISDLFEGRAHILGDRVTWNVWA